MMKSILAVIGLRLLALSVLITFTAVAKADSIAPGSSQKAIHTEDKGLSLIPLEQCTLPKVIKTKVQSSSNKQAQWAKKEELLIREIRAKDKTKNGNMKSAGIQTHEKQVDAYKKHEKNLQTINMVLFVESNYARDLGVIQKLVQTADDFYRSGKMPNEKSPDFIYFQILMTLRQDIPDPPISLSPNKQCSLRFVLENMERETEKQLDSQKINSSVAKVKQLSKKYHMKQIDPIQLDGKDKVEYNNIINNVARPIEFIFDMERIKLLANMSLFMYQSYMHAIAQSDGNVDYVSNIFVKMAKQGKLNKVNKELISMWIYIDQKVPNALLRTQTDFANRMSNEIKKQMQIN